MKKLFCCCKKKGKKAKKENKEILNKYKIENPVHNEIFSKINIEPIDKDFIEDWGEILYEYYEKIDYKIGTILYENNNKIIFTFWNEEGVIMTTKIIFLNNLDVIKETEFIKWMIDGVKLASNKLNCNNLSKYSDSYLSYYNNKKCIIIEYEYLPDNLYIISTKFQNNCFSEGIVSNFIRQIINGLIYLKNKHYIL